MIVPSEIDITYMQRALALAEAGCFTARPNPQVGCVLVKDGNVIGEGFHAACGQMHAEVAALQHATNTMGATCYVTLEPCAHQGHTPPCVDALVTAGVSRVVTAMEDPNPRVQGKGHALLKAHGIEVQVGVLEEQAKALNAGFISRFMRGRPYVRAKVALSLDGRIAMASGESQWITDEAARERVQCLRAKSGAIITGINTVLKDNPRLTVRSEHILEALPPGTTFQQPFRVVLDRQARAPKEAAIFSDDAPTLHVTGDHNLNDLLEAFGDRDIHDVLLEAGPTLLGAFLQADLIDELILFYAPKILGHQGLPMAYLPLEKLSEHIAFEMKHIEQIGPDMCMTMTRRQHGI